LGKLHSGPPKTKGSRRRVSLPGASSRSWPSTCGRRAGRPTTCSARRPAGRRGSTGSGIASGCRRRWTLACRAAHPRPSPHGGGAVDRRRGFSQGGRRPSRPHLGQLVLDRYGHLFPESDAVLRDRLDVLFCGATEHRRSTAG
jgi:hypothetical protein